MDRVTMPFSRTDNKMGGYDAVALTESLGPSYQAALGAMVLADDPAIRDQSGLYDLSAAEEMLLNMPAVQGFADGGLARPEDFMPTDPEGALLEGSFSADRTPPLEVLKGWGKSVYGLGKGALQGTLGMGGDIEQFGRVVAGNENPTFLPTSDDVKATLEKFVPNWGTPAPSLAGTEGRTAEEFLGEFLSLPGMGAGLKTLKKAPEAAKNLLTSEPARRLIEKVAEPVQLYAVPKSPVKKVEPIFERIPNEDFNFVSKLDEYAASMPTQTKEQLLGYVKKNFKEHDQLRVERALKDLAPTDKVDASTMVNAIHDLYNPAGFRTTVLSPRNKAYFQDIDNPFPNKPIGVIHLTREAGIPRPGQLDINRLMRESNYLFSKYASPEKQDIQLWNGFKAQAGTKTLPETKKAIDLAGEAIQAEQRVVDEEKLLDDFISTQKYKPSIALLQNQHLLKSFKEIENARLPWEEQTKLENEWNANMLKEIQSRLRAITGNSPETPMDVVYRDARVLLNQMAGPDGPITLSRNARLDALNSALTAIKADPKIVKPSHFAGDPSHSSLNAPGQPILFSRFSEHTINTPDLGQLNGIYVTEMQSDQLDALRKLGSNVPGQKQADVAQFGKIAEELPRLRDANSSKAVAKKEKQGEALSKRILKGSYDVPEAFAGMSTNSPQVQMLAVKNAVNGAIKMGKQFVAFTPPNSAFSSQAQLYEKIEHNVKQVVKELGSGFEARSITLPDATPRKSELNTLMPLTTWAIVWSPKVTKEGLKAIPFKHGGSVARQMLDNL